MSLNKAVNQQELSVLDFISCSETTEMGSNKFNEMNEVFMLTGHHPHMSNKSQNIITNLEEEEFYAVEVRNVNIFKDWKTRFNMLNAEKKGRKKIAGLIMAVLHNTLGDYTFCL